MAGKGRFHLAPLAQDDLEAIWLYTRNTWSADQADAYVLEFIGAFEDLATGERIGTKVALRDGYFRYLVGSHAIFYKHSDTGIDVIRVLHQAMNVDIRL